MSNELCVDTSSLCINQYEDAPYKGVTVPQNITVILPAYNEEDSIGSVILLTKFYADNVIVVDDGSSDRTAEIARKAGAEVIIHETNTGKGGALKTGFTAAANLGADIIVTMDSDGQHNPAEIPKLVAPIIKGEAEMVNGSRYLSWPGQKYARLPTRWPDSSGQSYQHKFRPQDYGFSERFSRLYSLHNRHFPL